MAYADINEGDKTCWICLESCSNDDSNAHFRPCSCPRLCHKACLARWCLQQAGKSEEKKCRFCYCELPDWRKNLTLQPGLESVVPKMGINFNGITHLVDVEPGEAGKEKFIAEVRNVLNMKPEQQFDVVFECRLPARIASGNRVDLSGLTAYDAAVYCAALKAAERIQNESM